MEHPYYINKNSIEVFELNNICLNDIKRFNYIEDGRKQEYTMTFIELLDLVGVSEAVLYWFDIEPDEATYEDLRDLYLIDEEEYQEMKEREV